MHIGLIGSARFGTGEPHAGGLEAHVATLAARLRTRGHRVTLLPERGIDFEATEVARRDVGGGPEVALAEHHAYLTSLVSSGDVDLLHNHSVHYLPVAMAPALRVPMVTTLHSPPTPWLESAFRISGHPCGPVVSVSEANARDWRATVPECGVVHNGIDLARFHEGPGGGGYAAWYGRIVPEKGVGDAIEAAGRAGLPIRIAGPIHDEECFDREVRPHLGPEVRYEGHLDATGLNDLVGHAEVTLVTPRWEEPYGLVVAESLAMGTPVAATRRGGVPEILDDHTGRLAAPDDIDALTHAVVEARGLDRGACRRRAEEHCDVEGMVDRYLALYELAVAR